MELWHLGHCRKKHRWQRVFNEKKTQRSWNIGVLIGKALDALLISSVEYMVKWCSFSHLQLVDMIEEL